MASSPTGAAAGLGAAAAAGAAGGGAAAAALGAAAATAGPGAAGPSGGSRSSRSSRSRSSRGRGGRHRGSRRLSRPGHQRRDLVPRQRTAEVAHRPARREHVRRVLARLAQHELPLGQPTDGVTDGAHVDPARGRAHPVQQAGLVPLGLQPPDHPRPGVGDGLVVDVDRVLRRQHDPDAEGSGLLHERHDRLLRRRRRGRRHVTRDLVHVDEGAQVRGAALLAHPRDQLRQDEGHDELALLVGQVRDGHDRRGRLAVCGPQQAADVERRAVGPGRERGRGQQPVQLDGERRAVGGREELVELEHAQLAHRRLLHLADQRAQVERLALRPGRLDEVAEQDVLARRERVGGDADQAEQAGHVALDLVADHLHVAHVGGGLERAHDVERHARRRARRVDGEADRVPQRLDAVGRDAPAGQAVLPGAGLLLGERVRCEPGLLRVPVVDPGAEVGRGQVGERQAEVGEVALGVDQQAGHAGGQRLLDEHHAEPGLAGPGHAHDHAVGREIAGPHHRRGAVALVRSRIDQLAEVQVSHGGDCRPGSRAQREAASDGGAVGEAAGVRSRR